MYINHTDMMGREGGREGGTLTLCPARRTALTARQEHSLWLNLQLPVLTWI